MANQMYGFGSSYGGSGFASYTSRPGAGDSGSAILAAARYHQSDPPAASAADASEHYSVDRSSVYGGDIGGYSSGRISNGVGYDPSSWGGAADLSFGGMKRSTSDAFYHQNLLGTHSAVGQNEALYPANSLVKRPRLEVASNLPVYPQRPGEKDCAHYMMTRTCKFGDSCRFDHPIWVPEGGMPDWKEVPFIPADSLPENPGEPDCPYFMKTQRCKFGMRCKFNHPKDNLIMERPADASVLPERPSEPICSFYSKTGKCKFGATCKFHHPKDLQPPAAEQDPESGGQIESVVNNDEKATVNAKPSKTFIAVPPAIFHNSKGLPIRPGETDCPFYLKTGSCKYGTSCRYNHPDRYSYPPTAASLGHAIMASTAAGLSYGAINPAAAIMSSVDPHWTQTTMGLAPAIYPQRPGQAECDYYMKTGQCKFGERCKFHHPTDWMGQASNQTVKLTLAGLPRREGVSNCPFYMKTGTCKYGASCRFDHPPPGEVIAMVAAQGASDGDQVKEAIESSQEKPSEEAVDFETGE
ncbi:Zinc finger CCCH domain-containing protein 37 [Acorus gramineus]|uniref:Zinc finger CCCH domain-containing protein 37 n=1 Tax=Acorus gramineus TaxID=55184 RepID=A0AAV9AUQ0_ACOGR|nr:Zinc finger CCCH domain-containing protein 37 [Acorus gramineus]